jgi:ectoine hydroxylase-related dioxygenase (phytanoyl-CoA dioxygenase family)
MMDRERFEQEGFGIEKNPFGAEAAEWLTRLRNAMQVAELVTSNVSSDGAAESSRRKTQGGYARRGLLRNVPTVCDFAASQPVQRLVTHYLSSAAVPVRGIYFDKSPGANWKVTWHQDANVALADRIETPGFGPWSRKDGYWQARPPAAVLENMVTLRLHLDNCPATNGPLRVLPGSHRHGLLDEDAIQSYRHANTERICAVNAGDIVVMKPLLLHASSEADEQGGGRRRMVHIEFADVQLPYDLNFAIA